MSVITSILAGAVWLGLGATPLEAQVDVRWSAPQCVFNGPAAVVHPHEKLTLTAGGTVCREHVDRVERRTVFGPFKKSVRINHHNYVGYDALPVQVGWQRVDAQSTCVGRAAGTTPRTLPPQGGTLTPPSGAFVGASRVDAWVPGAFNRAISEGAYDLRASVDASERLRQLRIYLRQARRTEAELRRDDVICGHLVADHPRNVANLLVEHVRDHHAQPTATSRKKLLEYALELDPGNGQATRLLARLYLDSGDHVQALQTAHQAVQQAEAKAKASPSLATSTALGDALMTLADALSRRKVGQGGDLARAALYYGRAAKAYERFGHRVGQLRALTARADHLRRMRTPKSMDAAVAAFEEADRIAPDVIPGGLAQPQLDGGALFSFGDLSSRLEIAPLGGGPTALGEWLPGATYRVLDADGARLLVTRVQAPTPRAGGYFARFVGEPPKASPNLGGLPFGAMPRGLDTRIITLGSTVPTETVLAGPPLDVGTLAGDRVVGATGPFGGMAVGIYGGGGNAPPIRTRQLVFDASGELLHDVQQEGLAPVAASPSGRTYATLTPPSRVAVYGRQGGAPLARFDVPANTSWFPTDAGALVMVTPRAPPSYADGELGVTIRKANGSETKLAILASDAANAKATEAFAFATALSGGRVAVLAGRDLFEFEEPTGALRRRARVWRDGEAIPRVSGLVALGGDLVAILPRWRPGQPIRSGARIVDLGAGSVADLGGSRQRAPMLGVTALGGRPAAVVMRQRTEITRYDATLIPRETFTLDGPPGFVTTARDGTVLLDRGDYVQVRAPDGRTLVVDASSSATVARGRGDEWLVFDPKAKQVTRGKGAKALGRHPVPAPAPYTRWSVESGLIRMIADSDRLPIYLDPAVGGAPVSLSAPARTVRIEARHAPSDQTLAVVRGQTAAAPQALIWTRGSKTSTVVTAPPDQWISATMSESGDRFVVTTHAGPLTLGAGVANKLALRVFEVGRNGPRELTCSECRSDDTLAHPILPVWPDFRWVVRRDGDDLLVHDVATDRTVSVIGTGIPLLSTSRGLLLYDPDGYHTLWRLTP